MTRQRDALKFPNYPTAEMRERMRSEQQVPVIKQKEVMPVELRSAAVEGSQARSPEPWCR